MALGIDIYRYQTVTDWDAVKRHGVSFVYVKGTDGGKPAIVRADNQVRGAHSVGIPVGLYHYAQLTPSPETQADVLTAEVRRLGATGLPPALDLEEPHKAGAVARDFAHRFLARMRANGFDQVTLYANTSMLTGIDALQIDDDPNVLIWAAAYGPNDGRRHPLGYRGRVTIHQYTSVGRVPGISGDVDLNESSTLEWIKGEDDVTVDELLKTELVWWNGNKATIREILTESFIVSRGLRGVPAFAGETEPVQLPPLVNISTALAGLSDDEVKVVTALQSTSGAVLGALAEILTGLQSVDGSPSDEQMARLQQGLAASLGGAYTVTITKTDQNGS